MSKLLWKFSAGLVAIAVLAWGLGLLWFASTIPTAVEDTATRTDAIVVLTGGSERIETALGLLEAGLADRVFVSGVGQPVKTGDVLPQARNLSPELRAKITVGTSADNTPGNAVETEAWAKTAGVQSIRLVTAAYHMRRSLLEFHAAMPEISIVPHAVFPANVKSDWWRWPGTASLIAREYSKFVVTWAIQHLGRDGAPLAHAAPAHAALARQA